jgi:hypothetical protein
VNTTRTGWICYAELIGVKQQGIRIRDIELLLLAHETGTLARDVLNQSLPEGRRKLIELFLGEVNPEIMFALLPLKHIVVTVLPKKKKVRLTRSHQVDQQSQ